VRIGVLALQGAFREHILALEAIGASAVAVRLPAQLDGCDGLIIPGGESTAIAKLMDRHGFYESVQGRCREGMAVWGTCAGAILIAKRISDGLPGQRSLGLLDIQVRRNAYGRQSDSFEAGLEVKGLDEPFQGIFIRAPWIESVGEGVRVLAEHDGRIVAVRSASMMATTFHPELTRDLRLHRYFVSDLCSRSRLDGA